MKTQSVKQKCFESITQSIQRLYKPQIKSYQIQKRKTDKQYNNNHRLFNGAFALCSMPTSWLQHFI